jgi:RNA polymerase sigma-70 factor (ECF subfamily)
MDATSYNPDKVNVLPAGILREQSLRNAESEAGKFLGSQPSSRSRLRGGSYECGYTEASDDDLIAGALCGDQQAFAELCARHTAIVKYKIFRIVRNQEDAEDALQETLLRAYTHLSSFRGSCRFATWLTAIGVNAALMMMRKQSIRREAYASTSAQEAGAVELQEPVDRSPGPEGIYLKQQTILLVRREVEKLQPSLRSVVSQYYGSECSLEQAAKTQAITLAAAKSRLMRGRVRLRSSLAGYGISKSRH